MQMTTSIAEIQNIITSIQARRSNWRLSVRPKNLLTLSKLGIDSQVVFDIIDNTLTWKDYVSSPEKDNHLIPIPGDIWVFRLNIQGEICYLKFQDRSNSLVMWISIHIAEYPLKFPYR